MSMAREVLDKVGNASAVTFIGGYAVVENSRRVFFPPATAEKERRNDQGRVTYGLYRFPDKSGIELRFHPLHGARFRLASEG